MIAASPVRPERLSISARVSDDDATRDGSIATSSCSRRVDSLADFLFTTATLPR